MNICSDIKGIIRGLNFSSTNVLCPIYEGVVNAIQAIDERKDLPQKDGAIRVFIQRDLSQQTLFEEFANYPLKRITIEDNGIGFNEENLVSFQTAHTTKKLKLGGKGLGRFAMLAIFRKISVYSVFNDKEGHRKEIRFVLTDEGITKPELANTDKGCGTSVILEDLDPKYQKLSAKYDQEYIADGILKHCLLYYLNEEAPRIEVIENDQTINLKNQFFPHQYLYKKVKGKIGNSSFTWFFVCNNKGSYHDLVLAANNRQVKSKRIEKILPLFSSPVRWNQEDTYFTIYLVSEYLNEKVNFSRTGFNFPKTGEEDEQFSELDLDLESIISEKDIENKTKSIIKSTFSQEMDQRTTETKTRVNIFLNSDDGIGYRHLKVTDEFLSLVPNDADDKKLDDLFHDYQYQRSKENRKNKEKLFKAEYSNRPEYKELLDKVINASTEEGISNLAQYVAHRRTIIELLEKYLSWCDENQNYEDESVLHNLIYTMGGTSETVPYDKHNLWLLDDRLAFHRYIYSDLPIKSHKPKKGSTSGKEPDITIYDVRFTYAQGNEYGVVNSIVLFELKRPNRKVTYAEFSEQMIDQILAIQKGQIKDYRGKSIQTDNSTPIFFYYVCDVEAFENLREKACIDGFRVTPYGSLLRIASGNTIQEILTYQTLLINAKRRNMLFFEKLGIK